MFRSVALTTRNCQYHFNNEKKNKRNRSETKRIYLLLDMLSLKPLSELVLEISNRQPVGVSSSEVDGLEIWIC